MSSLLITGGRVIDPANSFDAVVDVLLRDGKIAAVGVDAIKQAQPNCERLDARNKIVCPGLIDLHVHLREPGQSAKETIATAAGYVARQSLSKHRWDRNGRPRNVDTPGHEPIDRTDRSRPPESCSTET